MAYKGIVSRVRPHSLADDAGIKPGDRIISVNGQNLADIIDLSFALADEAVEILKETADGSQQLLKIQKRYDEDLGIEFESAVFDSVRRCANRCIFCFVDQMPAGMRESLYVKDDDYRLSFLYGNFVTLSNIGPRDLKRIRQMHLSPLYISVHATDGALRARMLGNERSADIMDQLKELVNYGIEIHTQVVLCPGFNDGEQLTKTFLDLRDMHPSVLSMAIVPVGLTQFRSDCPNLSTFTPEGAAKVIAQVAEWQQSCREELGSTFVYLADEFYLNAGMPIPDYETYDDFPQLENGIGLVRNFLYEWENADAVPKAYEQPAYIDVVCGVSAEKILSPLLAKVKVPGLVIRVVPVINQFFGPSITVTGLLTGADILEKLRKLPGNRTGIILPGVALRKGEAVFLDNLTPQDLEKQLGVPVRPAYFAGELKQLLYAWR